MLNSDFLSVSVSRFLVAYLVIAFFVVNFPLTLPIESLLGSTHTGMSNSIHEPSGKNVHSQHVKPDYVEAKAKWKTIGSTIAIAQLTAFHLTSADQCAEVSCNSCDKCSHCAVALPILAMSLAETESVPTNFHIIHPYTNPVPDQLKPPVIS